MSRQPIDYYDAEKRELGGEHPVHPREWKAIDSIRRHATRRDAVKLLDVGCGDGTFLAQVGKDLPVSWELHGVDYSDYVLEVARRLPYEFQQWNLEDGIPYDDESFDVVYSGEVIEHLYNPDHLLSECRRVLRPDGMLVISTPNLQAWYNRLLFAFGIQPIFHEVSTKSTAVGAGPLRRFKETSIPVGHVRLFNLRALRDLAENEGFTPVEVTGATFPVLPKRMQYVDRWFTLRPSLSSILILTARKTTKTSP